MKTLGLKKQLGALTYRRQKRWPHIVTTGSSGVRLQLRQSNLLCLWGAWETVTKDGTTDCKVDGGFWISAPSWISIRLCTHQYPMKNWHPWLDTLRVLDSKVGGLCASSDTCTSGRRSSSKDTSSFSMITAFVFESALLPAVSLSQVISELRLILETWDIRIHA